MPLIQSKVLKREHPERTTNKQTNYSCTNILAVAECRPKKDVAGWLGQLKRKGYGLYLT